jgi:hypothetical protein
VPATAAAPAASSSARREKRDPDVVDAIVVPPWT